LKFVLDGGPEGGALDEPYSGDPSFTGHLNWDPDEMFAVMRAGVERSWRIGTPPSVIARCARCSTSMDVWWHVTPVSWTLVIEHAFVADKTQRARAIGLGVAITVQ